MPGRIYLTCMYEALFWTCFITPLTYFRDVLYTLVHGWVIGPVWASASSSIKVRIILSCLAKCYDSEFLKHCQLQASIKYMGMQRMVITLILSAVGVLPRDLSTTGISLISLFEVVCQNAFQFARETICMHLGACQNISEKQNAFSRSFQITEHLHNT